ncbi:MAG: leucyl/phenylalanyl-tRNA--protein transferase [Rhizobiales bacterium]|nr:leucyl/phenylalanyl-tRNA--protein transferase [Hyphomicrobiales bacterium]
MTSRNDILLEITPQVLLKAYAVGIFPMAESAEDPGLYWIEPETRGIMPLERFHLPRRLRRTVAQGVFDVRIDHDFEAVIAGCAAPAEGRPKTWINERIRRLYGELFDLGYCHTVEAWRDGRLVGGLYGIALGAAFFGESMFSRERDASKVALVHLVARPRAGGFRLPAAQFPPRPGARRGGRLLPGRVDRGGVAAVGQPDVVDRVVDGVEARARGEHPAREDAPDLAVERDLVDLDEGVGQRRLGRGAAVAGPRRDLQRAELHRLVDIDVEGDDAAGDLVEPGEDGDGIGDPLGRRRLDLRVLRTRLERGQRGNGGEHQRRQTVAVHETILGGHVRSSRLVPRDSGSE